MKVQGSLTAIYRMFFQRGAYTAGIYPSASTIDADKVFLLPDFNDVLQANSVSLLGIDSTATPIDEELLRWDGTSGGRVQKCSATAPTLSDAGILNVNNTTDASNGTDGSLQTDGGLSVAKKAWIGTGFTLAAGTATFPASGIILTGVSANHIFSSAAATSDRTFALPNASLSFSTPGSATDVVPLLGAAQTFSAIQTMSSGVIGSGPTTTDLESIFVATRTIAGGKNNTGTHCFSDKCTFARSGDAGNIDAYASFNAWPLISGGESYDHYVAFQAYPHLSSYTGTITHFYGAYLHADFAGASATVTNAYGVYIPAWGSGATVGTSIGIYLADQTVGTTKYAIKSDSTAQSVFAGNLSTTKVLAVGNDALDATHTFVGAGSGKYQVEIWNKNTTAGTSYGLGVLGGTNASDRCQAWVNAANTVGLGHIKGNGSFSIGPVSTTTTEFHTVNGGMNIIGASAIGRDHSSFVGNKLYGVQSGASPTAKTIGERVTDITGNLSGLGGGQGATWAVSSAASIPVGCFDVFILFSATAFATSPVSISVGFVNNNNTDATGLTEALNRLDIAASAYALGGMIGPIRINVSATTSYYFKALVSGGSGTDGAVDYRVIMNRVF